MIIQFNKSKPKNQIAWIPKETKPYCEGCVTVGRSYPVYYDKVRDEEYIMDNLNQPAVWHMSLEGEFVHADI
jgi:hypothetical protein